MNDEIASTPTIIYPTRKEIVIERIRDDLLTDKVKPEQVLNITELAEKYCIA